MKKGRIKDLDWKKRFSYTKHVIYDEKDFKKKGMKFQVVKFVPGESIKPHYHKVQTEVFYIAEGKGVVKLNGEEHTLEVGDFFLCEKGDTHEFINNSNEDLMVLVFRVDEPPDGDLNWVDNK